MKIVTAVVAFGALAVVGCSSGSGDDPLGPDPDLGQVEAHFENPDGTFNEGNAQKVLGGQNQAASMNFTSTSAASSSSDSDTEAPGIQCDALKQGQESGTCACPDGGSFSYAVHSERVNQTTDITMKMKMTACSFRGTTIDGRQYMKMHIDQAAKDKLGMSMLFVLDGTVTKEGQTHSVSIEQRMQSGTLSLAMRVDDGWVSLRYETGSGTSGKLVVKDRRGTWTCTSSNAHGECTSDKGETQKF